MEAFIAIAIYILIQLLCFNTANINVLASGIYLGLAKNINKKTNLIFYFGVMLFNILDNILLKNGLVDPLRGIVGAIFVVVLSSAMIAAIPLGIMWIIRKIRKV